MPLLEHSLTPAELDLFRSLTTPRKIQDFLDTVRYEPERVFEWAAIAVETAEGLMG